MLIPRQAAFAAVQEFFRTGQRPTNLEWEPSDATAARLTVAATAARPPHASGHLKPRMGGRQSSG
jgi:hypothetical protein